MISVYWQKVRNNEIINLTGNMSNTYEVQADDVGMNIIANINSQEEQYKGVCKIQFDPILMEPSLKVNLYQCVNSNFIKFDVKLNNHNSKLSLNSEYLTLIDFKNKSQIRLKYYYNWPKLIHDYNDNKQILLVYNTKNTNKNSIRT